MSPDAEDVNENETADPQKKSNKLTYAWVGLSFILLISLCIPLSKKSIHSTSQISTPLEQENQGGSHIHNDSFYSGYHSDIRDSLIADTAIMQTRTPPRENAISQDNDERNYDRGITATPDTSGNGLSEGMNSTLVEFSPGETMRDKFGPDAYAISIRNDIELYFRDNGRKIILTSSQDALYYSKLGYTIYAIIPAHIPITLQTGI